MTFQRILPQLSAPWPHSTGERWRVAGHALGGKSGALSFARILEAFMFGFMFMSGLGL
jgi:hypothetical protein